MEEEKININLINKETLDLFKDEDFIKLIKIYIEKPILFKKFYMYISSGQIINNNLITTCDDLSIKENFNFIKLLNLGIDDNTISQLLIKHKNHLNFSIREIINIVTLS